MRYFFTILMVIVCIGQNVMAQQSEADSIPVALQKDNVVIAFSALFALPKNTISAQAVELIEKSRAVQMDLKAGFFLKDKWAVGVDISLNSSITDVSFGTLLPPSEFRERTLALGVFSRYYLPLERTWSMYGEVGIAYLRTLEITDNGTVQNSVDYYGTRYSLGAGFVFFPVSTVGFDVVLRYALQSEQGNVDDMSFTTVKSRLSFGVGFQVYLSELMKE